MMLRAGLTALMLAACAPSAAVEPAGSGQTREETLAAGLRAFDEGNRLAAQSPAEAEKAFAQAVEAFQKLVDAGVTNGKLYYNLGNARLKTGQIGKAIAAYRRAESLMPTNARLQENLQYARSLCKYDIPDRAERAVARTVLFWHYDTPLRWRCYAGLAAFVTFWALLTWRALRGRGSVRYLAGLAFVIWMTLAVSVGVDWVGASQPRAGVIAADEAVVRKGDGLGYARQFEEPLTDGVEFDALSVRQRWVHIRLPDGQEGWVPLAKVDLF
ncbi:MAG: tetratricopeptide repeat protein [Phycisphaerae bacterium]